MNFALFWMIATQQFLSVKTFGCIGIEFLRDITKLDCENTQICAILSAVLGS